MSLDKMSSEALLDELQKRFKQRDEAIDDSKKMLKKLQDVNERLKKSEENRTKFMSTIKNEFNNPLASMISLSSSLLKMQTDKKVHFIANALCEESFLLNFEIKNIISAADIESGTLSIESSRLDFKDILKEIKEHLGYQISNKNIDLDVRLELQDEIYGDREKTYLILVNLVSNAIEFSPKDSKVIVSIYEDANNICLKVQDFGEGISPSEYENIFKRFYQAHSGLNRSHRGLGLGLSVVKELVDVLDGSLEFTSSGGSTNFKVLMSKLKNKESDLFGDDDFMFASDDVAGEF